MPSRLPISTSEPVRPALRLLLSVGLAMALTGCITSSNPPPESSQQESDSERIGKKAENVARQPAVDIGVMRQNPPPILQEAQRAPYSLAGIKTCANIRQTIGQLDEVLGTDVDAVDDKGDPLPERLAGAGAQSIVNALIPFRNLVREATGAAEADRKFRMMVAAGMARRGFLKGIAKQRGCKI